MSNLNQMYEKEAIQGYAYAALYVTFARRASTMNTERKGAKKLEIYEKFRKFLGQINVLAKKN